MYLIFKYLELKQIRVHIYNKIKKNSNKTVLVFVNSTNFYLNRPDFKVNTEKIPKSIKYYVKWLEDKFNVQRLEVSFRIRNW